MRTAAGDPVWWAERTMDELGALGPETVALLPVGATEQHGPHLPTGTDTIIASWMCARAAQAAAVPTVVLPAVAVGCSYGHGFELPGTVAVGPEQLADDVRAVVTWAARTTRIERFVLVNAHVGNAAALNVATDHLRLHHPELRTAVRDWGRLDPEVAAELGADADDWHANRGETAVMMAIAPETVRTHLVAGADDADRTTDLVFRYTAPRLSRNGVTGTPSAASAELGHSLAERSVTALTTLLERASVEEPPLAGWSPTLPAPHPPTPSGSPNGHHQAG